MEGAKGIVYSSKRMLEKSAYLRLVKMTDLHFSGAISRDRLVKIFFRSLRDDFIQSMARLRDLIEEKTNISFA
jgi:hypothetical protein